MPGKIIYTEHNGQKVKLVELCKDFEVNHQRLSPDTVRERFKKYKGDLDKVFNTPKFCSERKLIEQPATFTDADKKFIPDEILAGLESGNTHLFCEAYDAYFKKHGTVRKKA